MKSLKIVTLVLFLTGLNASAIEISDGVYQIGTAQDLTDFAELVNSGETNANAVLTADIDLSNVENFTPMAHHNNPYSGTFDGKGHVISNLKIELDQSATEAGFFWRISGATVQNLGFVNATVKNPSGWRVGVLAGCSLGANINNCYTAGDIVLECNGQIGGLVGLFSGPTVTSCFTTYETIGAYESTTFINTYWGSDVQDMSLDGSLCYKLNGNQQNIMWYQTLVEDKYPTLDNTHMQVFPIGEMKCDGTFLSEDISFTNDKNAASQIPPHNYENGKCTTCGQLDTDYISVVDGWYEVGTPSELLYISDFVNSDNSDINIRLTADIDLSGISYFPPIGTQIYPQGPMLHYGGTFDGQGHVIYNLSIVKDDEGAETGLFGRLQGATVKNLGIVNATIKNASALRAGVLAGSCVGNSMVMNCFTTGDFVMEDCICNYNHTNGDGLIGLISNATVRSCYTTHDTLADAENSTVENCYCGEEAREGAPTGELCYKLNGNSFLNPIWHQTIGEDDYPVSDSTHGTVYLYDEDTYASFQDEASFKVFLNQIVTPEKSFLEDVIATQSVIDECKAAVDGLSSVSDIDEFTAAYKEYLSLKDKLQESATAYEAFKQVAEETIRFLDENKDFQGKLRDQLVSYLEDDLEPNEDFENGSYPYIMEKHSLTTEEIQAETAKLQKMLETALAYEYGPGAEITELLKNGDFKDGWNGWDNGLANDSYYHDGFDIVGCEAWNTDGKIEQTVDGLKNGVYFVSMTAAYRPSNDPMSYAYNAYIYLNDNCVYIPSCYETYMPAEEAQDGVNCNLSIPSIDMDQPVTDDEGAIIGYAIHGTASIAIAAAAGRSMCCMVAQVNDGKLTIGLNNLGSKYGSDWTGWSGIHLTYLGSMEQAEKQLDAVLAGQVERANTLLYKYTIYTDNYYPKSPNFSNVLRDQLTAEIAEAEAASTPEAKYAVVEKFSQTFKDIYLSKRQYIEVINNVENLVSAAAELYPTIISDEENDAVYTVSNEAWSGFEDGTLNYDELTAQIQSFSFCPLIVDGWCEINNPAQLTMFSKLVNNGQANLNARLTSDIDLSGISYFPPIGTQIYPTGPMLHYGGTFDGQGHVIYNLSIVKDDEGAETGLFGRLEGATVKNLGIVNATLKNSSALRAGVLAGSCIGNSTVMNCFTTGDFVMEECICSYNHTNGDGLIGLISGANVRSCYTTHDTLADAEYSTVENCYCGEEAREGAPTGELCYKLNGDQSNITWYQNLGEDAYPVLNAEHGIVIQKEDGGYETITGIMNNVAKVENGSIYNLQGQKVEKPTKGIYIIHGRKTFIK